MAKSILVANYLSAPKDRNGNPRRGWHVREIFTEGAVIPAEQKTEWWVEEGLQGSYSLLLWEVAKFGLHHCGMHVHGEYPITVAKYNELRKALSD